MNRQALVGAGCAAALLVTCQTPCIAAEEPKKPQISLSLKEAVDRGLRHNLAVLLGEQANRFQEGKRWEALKDVLPNVSAFAGRTREMLNPAAFGFPGPVIGPFDVFEARVVASQPSAGGGRQGAESGVRQL